MTVGGAIEGGDFGAARGEEAAAQLCEGDDLGVALGRVGQELRELGGDVLGGEAVLEKLGHDTAAGDEIGHGDGQVAGGIRHVGGTRRDSGRGAWRGRTSGARPDTRRRTGFPRLRRER